jgi:pyruvate/2-oxoglutarate dehydrogenase complex dihydrolipoamide dehydrogenase (E3) component
MMHAWTLRPQELPRGPNAIEIDGEALLQAKHFVIATGAQLVPLAFPGAEHLITNGKFLGTG